MDIQNGGCNVYDYATYVNFVSQRENEIKSLVLW